MSNSRNNFDFILLSLTLYLKGEIASLKIYIYYLEVLRWFLIVPIRSWFGVTLVLFLSWSQDIMFNELISSWLFQSFWLFESCKQVGQVSSMYPKMYLSLFLMVGVRSRYIHLLYNLRNNKKVSRIHLWLSLAKVILECIVFFLHVASIGHN